MTGRSPDERIDVLTPLLDRVRRSLYFYVVEAGRDVGRDEAARALGISRALAAFHLDKLVDEGFLQADYARLSGRTGRGAGRPAKVYRSAGKEVQVAVPPRDYELAARVLLEGAVTDGASRRRIAAARRVGRALGREHRRPAGRRASARSLSRALTGVLEERGFQPTVGADGVIRVRNCPFNALASDYRPTVCRLNLALLKGVLDGLAASHLVAIPADPTGGCCVEFHSV